jgi:hypothetical protein
MIRHSGESRNPENSTNWTPAFAGVTDLICTSIDSLFSPRNLKHMRAFAAA